MINIKFAYKHVYVRNAAGYYNPYIMYTSKNSNSTIIFVRQSHLGIHLFWNSNVDTLFNYSDRKKKTMEPYPVGFERLLNLVFSYIALLHSIF